MPEQEPDDPGARRGAEEGSHRRVRRVRAIEPPLAHELRYDVAKQCHHDNNGHCYIEVQVKPEVPLLQPLSQIHRFRFMLLRSFLGLRVFEQPDDVRDVE